MAKVPPQGARAATAALAARAALSAPLLPKASQARTADDDSLSSASVDDADADGRARKLGPAAPLSARSAATALLAGGGLAASAVAVAVVPSVAVVLMGGVCLWNAPAVAKNHLRIAKSGSIRDSMNKMREERDHLASEVDFVVAAVDELEVETRNLLDVEGRLGAIAQQQNTDVTRVVDLVNKNEVILTAMKAKLRQTFVQAMIAIVMASDDDGDMKIDHEEIRYLALRLQIQLDPYGVELDVARFEEMIKENNDISHVCKFCGELLFEDQRRAAHDEAADDASLRSELTADLDLEGFGAGFGEDGEEPPMTYHEKAGMLTVGGKFSQGSVEVARGGRMTVVANPCGKVTRRRTLVQEARRRAKAVERPPLLMACARGARTQVPNLGAPPRVRKRDLLKHLRLGRGPV